MTDDVVYEQVVTLTLAWLKLIADPDDDDACLESLRDHSQLLDLEQVGSKRASSAKLDTTAANTDSILSAAREVIATNQYVHQSSNQPSLSSSSSSNTMPKPQSLLTVLDAMIESPQKYSQYFRLPQLPQSASKSKRSRSDKSSSDWSVAYKKELEAIKAKVNLVHILSDYLQSNQENIPRIVTRVVGQLGILKQDKANQIRNDYFKSQKEAQLQLALQQRQTQATVHRSSTSSKPPTQATRADEEASTTDDHSQQSTKAVQFLSNLQSEAQKYHDRYGRNITQLSATNRPTGDSALTTLMNEFVDLIEEKLSDQSLFTSTPATTASTSGDDGIYLGTVHSSKGREWQHVYLIDADDQTYTSYRTRQTAPDVAKEPAVKKSGNQGQTAEEDEEELGSVDDSKNLLYVACSRAKSHLTIAYAGNPPPAPAPATTDPTSNNTSSNTTTANTNTNNASTNRREISRYLRPLLKWKATLDKEVIGSNGNSNTTGTSKRSAADQEILERMNTWLVIKKVNPSTLNSSSSTNRGSDSVLVSKTSTLSSSAIRQVSSFQVPPHRPPSAGNNSLGNSQGSVLGLASGFQRASSFHLASSQPTSMTTSHTSSSSTTVASTSTATTAHVSKELTRVLPTSSDKTSHPPSKRTKTEITAPVSQHATEISRSKSISDHFRPISGSFKTAATLNRGPTTTKATHTDATNSNTNTTVSHEGVKATGECDTGGDGGKENQGDKNGRNSVWDF